MITSLPDLIACCMWLKGIGYTSGEPESWQMPSRKCVGFEIACTGPEDRWFIWCTPPRDARTGALTHRHLRGEDLFVAPWVVEQLPLKEKV